MEGQILGYTVCICPMKRMPDLNELPVTLQVFSRVRTEPFIASWVLTIVWRVTVSCSRTLTNTNKGLNTKIDRRSTLLRNGNATDHAITPINEPRREKTGLRGFRPGPTQTGLYKLRKELEA